MASYTLINNLLADIPLVYKDADFKTVTIAAGALVGGATITVGSASVPSLGATLDVVVSMPAPGPAATVDFDLGAVVTRPNPNPPTA